MSGRPSGADLATLRGLVPDLLAYFGRRLDDAEDAADALGETLLVLWRRRAIPEEPEAMRRYAFGIARNVLASARRGRLRRRALADRIAEELAVAWSEQRPVAADLDLAAALAALADRDRELVLLVAWEGFGVAEAGAVLGLKPDAARQRYSRTRARLREVLASR